MKLYNSKNMEQQLQLKPFKRTPGFKYKVICITDITFHASHRQPSMAIAKNVSKSFTKNEPGRFYGFKTEELSDRESLIRILDEYVKKDPAFLKMVQEEEKNGVKLLLEIPTENIPIKFGNDVYEFISSKNGQRVIRGLNK